VWAINVVVVDVLGEQSMEVSLVDDDRVVQTLRAYRAHDAFADGVGVSRQMHRMGNFRSDFASSILSIH